MRKFDTFFDLPAVAKCLVNIEIKSRFSTDYIATNNNWLLSNSLQHHREIRSMLPPRRQWLRPDRPRRLKLVGFQVQTASIYDAVMLNRRLDKLDKSEWGKRLIEFSEHIQLRAQSLNCANVGRLRHAYIPKVVLANPDTTEDKTRQITYFDSLEDRVFWSLVNKFLSTITGSTSCVEVHGHRINYHKSANAIVDRIIGYRKLFGGTVFTAQIDICKLYNTISHNKVLEVFDELISVKNNIKDDTIVAARTLIKGYLALSKSELYNTSDLQRLNAELGGRLLSMYDTELPDIGLITGGSPSATLSNLILNVVDKLLLTHGYKELLYVRYVDNIFIAHREESSCKQALELITSGLSRTKLVAHKPKQLIKPSFDFYKSKSKDVHPWGHDYDECKWINFLGYQIRWDGVLRISLEASCAVKNNIIRRQRKIVRSLLMHNADWQCKCHCDGMICLAKSQLMCKHKIRTFLMMHLFGNVPAHELQMNLKREVKKNRSYIPYWTLLRGRNEISWRAAYSLFSIHMSDPSRMKSLDRCVEKMVHKTWVMCKASGLNVHYDKYNHMTFVEFSRVFSYYQAFRQRAAKTSGKPNYKINPYKHVPDVHLYAPLEAPNETVTFSWSHYL